MEEQTTPVAPPLRIGTRRSNLAVVQAEAIRNRLQQIAPGRSFEIEAMRTIGDKDQATALYSFGEKSLWTSELEEKLTSGQLDVVVHCRKDMPTVLPDSCELAAIPLRDDPRDALIVKAGQPYSSLKTLPEGAVVGTSYLRGNVETRLAKVDNPESEYTCMIMSAAGLQRLGLEHRISQYLGSKDGGILHAVGQGALGLEIRKGDTEILELVNQLGDGKYTLACLAERALLRTLEGGCSVPIGVETEWIDSSDHLLRMRAIVVSLDGSQCAQDTLDANVKTEVEAVAFGQEVAARLVKAGADGILKDINVHRPSKDS